MVTREEARPELFRAGELLEREGLPKGRVILAPDRDPAAPAFFEWELHAEAWSDEHTHEEYVFVLEGSLDVSAGGTRVSAVKGDLVRVPAGVRGTYSAPVFARVLSIYGPRPAGHHDSRGALAVLDPAPTGESRSPR